MKLTHYQVQQIVGEMVKASNEMSEYLKQPESEETDPYYVYREGLYDAYYDILSKSGYSVEEILQLELDFGKEDEE